MGERTADGGGKRRHTLTRESFGRGKKSVAVFALGEDYTVTSWCVNVTQEKCQQLRSQLEDSPTLMELASEGLTKERERGALLKLDKVD